MTEIKDTAEFYKKLAQKQEDKHNSLENIPNVEPNDYLRIVRSTSRYAPQAHVKTLEQYVSQAKMLEKFGMETSQRTHIDGVKQWYTHRDPRGCFMCDDQQFISVLVSMLEYISKIHPNIPLDHRA